MNKGVKLTKRGWLQMHRDTELISASQVSSALGFNPYTSPLTLYAQKLGLEPWPTETLAMRRGHRMEKFIGDEYALETGHKINNPGAYTIYQNPSAKYVFATPDFIVFDKQSHGLLECKAPARRDGWTEEDAPIGYQIQLQIQLYCVDLQWGVLAAVIGNELFTYRYERNQEFIDAALENIRGFILCCKTRTEPEADCISSTRQTLNKIHPSDNGARIILCQDAVNAGLALEECKEKISALEKEKEKHENILRQFIGDNTYGESAYGTWSLKTQMRAGALSVDPSEADRLRAIGIEFKETKPSTFRVLRKAK